MFTFQAYINIAEVENQKKKKKREIAERMISRENDNSQIKLLFFHVHMLPCIMSAEPSCVLCCNFGPSPMPEERKKKGGRLHALARDGKARLAMMDLRFGIYSLPTKGVYLHRQ